MQVLGLLSSGPRLEGHGTHNAPLFFQLECYTLLVDEKYYVSDPLVQKIRDN